MLVRLCRLGIAGVALAVTGCFGGAANPSYFPFYLPPGDVIQTHAKPPGRGYFADFDPKATRVELSPGQATAATGSEHVLIATVFDADGQPRRSRRVEWILEGPGEILEVDESGILPGRGYLQSNQRAVSYTSYRTHTFERGNRDPGDDFTVQPGQSWCIVRSTKPGETVVTAFAPEVHNHDRRTATARVSWGDSRFSFPAPQVSKSGGEVELRTTLHAARGESPDGLKVRYKVLDGAPAVLASSSAARLASSYPGGLTEVDVPTDAEGNAAARLSQPTPQGGTTRVGVEVVKPDAGGATGGTVLARRETTVEWGVARLTMAVQAPKSAAFNKEVSVTLVTGNAGAAASNPVTVRATLPGDVEFLRSEPPPTVTNGRQLIWAGGAIPAKGQQTVRLTVRPMRKAEATLVAYAETRDGLTAEARATLTVGAAALKLFAEVPDVATAGERFPLTVTLNNSGPAPAENVVAWVALPEGVAHASGKNPVELEFGAVPANDTRRLEVPLTARSAGRAFVTVNVTGDGGVAERSQVGIDVKAASVAPVPVTAPVQAKELPPERPKPAPAPPIPPIPPPSAGEPALTLDSLDFPPGVAEGGTARVRIVVRNRGTADADDIAVSLKATGLKPVGGTGADRRPAAVADGAVTFRRLDRLAAGSSAVFVAEVQGVTAGAGRVEASVTSRQEATALREEQTLRVTAR